MIGRAVWWFSVRFLAWALRRGVLISQAEDVLARSFPHRDQDWRDQLILDAVMRNRGRVVRGLSA